MITTESELEDRLAEPCRLDIEFMRRLEGDLLILGAGGKMGPSLAKRIGRARSAAGGANSAGRVIAVSRFSSPAERESIAAAGVETIVADLLDRQALERLPDGENVLFLAGRKFGSAGRPDLTWAINTMVPANVARRYAGSRIVAFSTGNVYPFVSRNSGGSVESDATDPRGEYAQSCLGRERIFDYFSREAGLRALILRLNYATDLRYGILPEIARKVMAEEPISLEVGHFNIIWQGDANSFALRALDLCQSPARVLNVTGPEIVSVRETALHFGRRFGKTVRFEGEDRDLALLNRSDECHRLLGQPGIKLDELMEMVAVWVESGGRSLAKPTRFDVTDGRF
jgi:nucleoside-diphosphate-sugar epimerase